MTLVHYVAEVKSGLLLEWPAEAQAIHLQPGDKIHVQLESNQDPIRADAKPVIDAENAAAIALLESWREKDATDAPEEIRRAEEELEEFKRNMNANRATTGERLVYLHP